MLAHICISLPFVSLNLIVWDTMDTKRPPVRIHFKYNIDTGDIEEFIIDDNAPAASEDYHDKIAKTIANELGHEPDIIDAGPVRLPQTQPQIKEISPTEKEKDTLPEESKEV